MPTNDNKLAKHFSEVTLPDSKPGSRRAYNRASRRSSRSEIVEAVALNDELAADAEALSYEDEIDGPAFELAWGEPWSQTEAKLARIDAVHERVRRAS